MTLGRRDFLQSGLLALAYARYGSSSAPQGTKASSLLLTPGQLYLVFDPRLNGNSKDCELKLHQFRRHTSNPVLKPEHLWEGAGGQAPGLLGRVQLYGSVIWDSDRHVFKMWYYGGCARPAGQPDIKNETVVCYATSDDGIKWEKPNLGLHELYGSKRNNVSSVGDAMPVIYRDLNATRRDRRYVKWSLQIRDGDDGVKANYCIYRFFSADGVRWTRERREPVIAGYPTKYLGGTAADVALTYWHPQIRRFVCYYKVELRNPNPAPNDQPQNRDSLRQFARFESEDGVLWDAPSWVLTRDEEDKPFDPYLQFYGLSVHSVGDFYFALPWLYHSNEGNFDIGLAYSIDTVNWVRPFRGQFVLPHASTGEWDSAMLFTSAHLVERDDLWWLYYCGCPYPHRKDKRYFAIGLAQMPRGRLVSVRSWRNRGTWNMGPVQLQGSQLRINASVLDCITVTLLDENLRPLEGYISKPMRGNALDLPVHWEGDRNLTPLNRRSIILQFELNDAELFGVTCE
jgi:hypothetical protein